MPSPRAKGQEYLKKEAERIANTPYKKREKGYLENMGDRTKALIDEPFRTAVQEKRAARAKGKK